MTAKKDLKRRIRERQRRTGESYVQARRAVLAEAPPSPAAASVGERIDVVEMDDYTDVATELGFRCSVSITHALVDEIEARTALARLRDVLLGTASDPAMEGLRAVALRGERHPRHARSASLASASASAASAPAARCSRCTSRASAAS